MWREPDDLTGIDSLALDTRRCLARAVKDAYDRNQAKERPLPPDQVEIDLDKDGLFTQPVWQPRAEDENDSTESP